MSGTRQPTSPRHTRPGHPPVANAPVATASPGERVLGDGDGDGDGARVRGERDGATAPVPDVTVAGTSAGTASHNQAKPAHGAGRMTASTTDIQGTTPACAGRSTRGWGIDDALVWCAGWYAIWLVEDGEVSSTDPAFGCSPRTGRPLRTRLFLFVSATLVAVCAAMALTTVFAQRSYLLGNLDQRVTDAAAAAARAASSAWNSDATDLGFLNQRDRPSAPSPPGSTRTASSPPRSSPTTAAEDPDRRPARRPRPHHHRRLLHTLHPSRASAASPGHPLSAATASPSLPGFRWQMRTGHDRPADRGRGRRGCCRPHRGGAAPCAVPSIRRRPLGRVAAIAVAVASPRWATARSPTIRSPTPTPAAQAVRPRRPHRMIDHVELLARRTSAWRGGRCAAARNAWCCSSLADAGHERLESSRPPSPDTRELMNRGTDGLNRPWPCAGFSAESRPG